MAPVVIRSGSVPRPGPYSPWISVLGRGRVGGLVVRAFAENVRGVDPKPT